MFQADDVPPMSWAIQEQFLSMTVYNSKLLQYPVNKNFNRLFFKKLIAFLKTEEIHDDFYTFLCSVMSDPKDAFSFVHYVVDNDITKTIIIRQTNSMVVNGTTGLKNWEVKSIIYLYSINISINISNSSQNHLHISGCIDVG